MNDYCITPNTNVAGSNAPDLTNNDGMVLCIDTAEAKLMRNLWTYMYYICQNALVSVYVTDKI